MISRKNFYKKITKNPATRIVLHTHTHHILPNR